MNICCHSSAAAGWLLQSACSCSLNFSHFKPPTILLLPRIQLFHPPGMRKINYFKCKAIPRERVTCVSQFREVKPRKPPTSSLLACPPSSSSWCTSHMVICLMIILLLIPDSEIIIIVLIFIPYKAV